MQRNYGRIEAQRLKLPISGWGHHKSTVRGCLCGHLHPRLFLKCSWQTLGTRKHFRDGKRRKHQDFLEGFPGGSVVKNSPAHAGDTGLSLIRDDPTGLRAAKPACAP